MPLPQEYLDEFGDPELNRIIKGLREGREAEEEEEQHYGEMTIEDMEREESRFIDRQNARDINRKFE